jgi:NAD(P)-dependent dehydrogenase (short-subunit alcohol dehydrogenase family)
MAERGTGSIVNFASTAGEFGSIRPSAAYAAAKGGVIAFTKSLAREVSPHGVRVNVVSPGPVGTPMLDAESEAAQAQVAERTLLGRLGTPGDIAEGVAYLIGDGAGWVTGEVLRINGGSLI